MFWQPTTPRIVGDNFVQAFIDALPTALLESDSGELHFSIDQNSITVRTGGWWFRKPFKLTREHRQRLHTACIAELARRTRASAKGEA